MDINLPVSSTTELISLFRHPSYSLIDSSEMVDTYGAAPDEVRGFVVGGWEACCNQEGKRPPQVLVV